MFFLYCGAKVQFFIEYPKRLRSKMLPYRGYYSSGYARYTGVDNHVDVYVKKEGTNFLIPSFVRPQGFEPWTH